MKLDQILETCLYVDNLEEARDFYENTLGLTFYSAAEGRHVFFKLNNGMFLLFDPKATREQSDEMPAHGNDGPGHAAFRVAVDEIPKWRARLEARGVEIETERVWPNGIPSLYFRDPAGNVLEITAGALWSYEDPV